MSIFYQQSFISGIWGKISNQLSRKNRQFALRRCHNYIVTPQGPITRRPGTRIVFTTPATDENGVNLDYSPIEYVIRVNHRKIGDWTLMLEGTLGRFIETEKFYTKDLTTEASRITGEVLTTPVITKLYNISGGSTSYDKQTNYNFRGTLVEVGIKYRRAGQITLEKKYYSVTKTNTNPLLGYVRLDGDVIPESMLQPIVPTDPISLFITTSEPVYLDYHLYGDVVIVTSVRGTFIIRYKDNVWNSIKLNDYALETFGGFTETGSSYAYPDPDESINRDGFDGPYHPEGTWFGGEPSENKFKVYRKIKRVIKQVGGDAPFVSSFQPTNEPTGTTRTTSTAGGVTTIITTTIGYLPATGYELSTYTKVKVEVVGDGSDFDNADYPFFMRVRGNNIPDEDTGVPNYGLIVITSKGDDADVFHGGRTGITAVSGFFLNGVVLRLFTPSNDQPRDKEAGSDNINGITAYQLPIWNEVDGYPSKVSTYQQRLLFGSSLNYPARVWASSNGRGFNFTSDVGGSGKLVPQGAVNFDIAGLISGGINAFSVKDSLFVHTDVGDFRVRGDTEQSDFSTLGVSVDRLNNIDSASAKSAIIRDDIVYIHKSKRQLRILQDSENGREVRNFDLSVLAEHLTKDYSFKQIVYIEHPNKILWGLVESYNEDGNVKDSKLLGLTYDRQLDVFAWHTHSLADLADGQNINHISVTEISGEEVLLLVTTDGRTISYLPSSYAVSNNPWYQDECFLDLCRREKVDNTGIFNYKKYEQPLGTLGDAVKQGYILLVDGVKYDIPTAEITTELIKLKEGNEIAFGIPYNSEMETLPLLNPPQHKDDRVSGIGTLTNITNVSVNVTDTGAIRVHTGRKDDGRLFAEARVEGDKNITPSRTFSGIYKGDLQDSKQPQKTLTIQNISPFPSTIEALFVEYETVRD